MKYKNIASAIHNFGYSFLSLMNYFDDEYVIDIIQNYVRETEGKNVDFNFFTAAINPQIDIDKKLILEKSVRAYSQDLKRFLSRQNVDGEKILSVILKISLGRKGYEAEIIGLDDRQKTHVMKIAM